MPILGLINIQQEIRDNQGRNTRSANSFFDERADIINNRNRNTPGANSFADESQRISADQTRSSSNINRFDLTERRTIEAFRLRNNTLSSGNTRRGEIEENQKISTKAIDFITAPRGVASIAGSVVKASRLLVLANRTKPTFGENVRLENNKTEILIAQDRITKREEVRKKLVDKIVIQNLDAGEEKGQDKIDNIILDAWPREVNYTPKSNFVAIASIARNNPHYQYTGSEDTIEFTIDWYTNTEDRDKVIRNCRRVEALSKANGYKKKPPRVKLVWGDQDRLFNGSLWIVVSAPYTMKDFQRAYRDSPNTVKRLGSMPQQALQTVTLKRITNTNLQWSEIKNVYGDIIPLTSFTLDDLNDSPNARLTA